MALPSNFRDYVAKISPGTWRREWGQKFVQGAIGLLFDMLAEGTQTAVISSKFGSRNFPDDVPEVIGRERHLPRFPGESMASYSARVHNAWSLWKQAGTNGGIIAMFAALGLTVTVMSNAEWNWDSQPENWSRIWVVFQEGSWGTSGTWGDGSKWGDGSLWGIGATRDEVRAVRDIVRKFKPAHVICPAICVVFDAVTWAAEQPDGTWDVLPNRSGAAIYLDG